MRTLTKLLPSLHLGIASVVVGAVLFPARVAHAQLDVTPPMPNVLLLIDTSGSMTRKMGSTALPDCSADDPADLNEGRWFSVVQALTGYLPVAGPGAISCESFDRDSSGDFETLFGTGLYDSGYYIPFQQLQSQGCGYVPGVDVTWPTDIFDLYPNNAIEPRGGCTFTQNPNGIIDIYKRQVRFGLMTFDPATDAEVGGNAAHDVDVTLGHKGTWSYWFKDGAQNHLNVTTPVPDMDQTVGSAADDGFAKGKPVACGQLLPMEVGARGPSAPPWEGRLMGFGDYEASSTRIALQNERIEKILLSMRPYGATPLAGMISDARDFLLNDTTIVDDGEPTGPVPLGPTDDPYWEDGANCRETHVIIITDGEPNLDLRPDCELPDPGGDPALDGVCPFTSVVDTSFFVGTDGNDSIVNKLVDDNNVVFHVVGVSLTTLTDPAGELCSEYSAGGPPAKQAICLAGTGTAEERTCCLLNAIADKGTTGAAQFVDDLNGLTSALSGVLTDIAAGTATRTAPVYQSVAPTFFVSDAAAGAVGHEVLSSLKTTVGDGLWGGRLERIRFQCDSTDPVPVPEDQDFDRALGDDFGFNLAQNPGGRFMITSIAATGAANSWASLRPQAPATPSDGMAKIDATVVASLASTWVDAVDETAFGVDSSPGGRCIQTFGSGASTDAACRSELLKWYTGMDSTAIGPSNINGAPTDGDRCPDLDPDTCKTLGGIYHSQPIIVGPPREFLRDEAYDVFAKTYEARPTVLYAATVDGQVHAFLLADNTSRLSPQGEANQGALGEAGLTSADDLELNELWSFVPPIALPFLESGVNRHQILLDGGLVAKSVVFERGAADAAGDVAAFSGVGYRTVLVGSSGNVGDFIPGGGYYFALDVTDPHAEGDDFDGSVPDNAFDESPKFLWQLSRGAGGATVADEPLFGASVPPAAVTTIAYSEPSSGDPPVEIAVAILAGGLSDGPAPAFTAAPYPTTVTLDGVVGTRSNRDWGAIRADRSITVVRLDTGEVLMRFRGLLSDPTPFDADVMAAPSGFLSPMSGTPVAFPGLAGQVSTRAYLGDADGVLWMLDMSNPDPSLWTVKMAWDAYHDLGGSIGTGVGEFIPGPVETLPVVSVDAIGNPVVVFATGSQEEFHRRTGTNFVTSLRDNPDDGPGMELAWEINLSNVAAPLLGGPGQRVTGPLNIFDGKVFFGTYLPDGDACSLGAGRIWGVRYIDPALAGVMGPAADELFVEDPTVIAFGVSVSQKPACRNFDIGAATETDAIFGEYTKFSASVPSEFELVVQSGRLAAPMAGPSTVATRFDLPTPPPTVRVDSWASIVE